MVLLIIINCKLFTLKSISVKISVIIKIGASESEYFGQNTSCKFYNYYLINKLNVFKFIINQMVLIQIVCLKSIIHGKILFRSSYLALLNRCYADIPVKL